MARRRHGPARAGPSRPRRPSRIGRATLGGLRGGLPPRQERVTLGAPSPCRPIRPSHANLRGRHRCPFITRCPFIAKNAIYQSTPSGGTREFHVSHLEYPPPLTDDEMDNLKGNARWALASNEKNLCANPPSIPRRCPKSALALTRTSAQARHPQAGVPHRQGAQGRVLLLHP